MRAGVLFVVRGIRDAMTALEARLEPAAAAAPAEPPPDEADEGPPAHWVERVRRGAPELLQKARPNGVVAPAVERAAPVERPVASTMPSVAPLKPVAPPPGVAEVPAAVES
ncbi:MAG: hypothetical protein KC620_23290, partial [Myxococcales bacterium]|nr:hypothetical protein [Myxococcales bacterium]